MSIVGKGYEFTLEYNNDERVVYPLNYINCSIIAEEQDDLIFLRKKFSGDLIFINDQKNYIDDFDYLFAIDRDATTRCNEIVFKVYNNGTLCFTGFFSVNKGKFDVDNCKFTISPEPYDKYKPIFEGWKIEYNMLEKDSGGSYLIPEVTVKSPNILFPPPSDYTRCRWLLDVIEYLGQKLIPTATVQSVFFTDATDYVTLQSNLNTLTVIAQKSDIIDPDSSEPATKAMISFSGLMDILKTMYNVWWDYDEDTDKFIIEHISYFGTTDIIDTRNDDLTKGTKKYFYQYEKIPQQETFEMMEAQYEDFIGKPIVYSGSCVTKIDTDKELKHQISVTTDIEWIENTFGNAKISPEGWVFMVCEIDGGNYQIIKSTGYLSLNTLENAHLSWANLLLNYHRHDRPLITGNLNGNDMEFVSTKKLIKQDEFSINGCGCGDDMNSKYLTLLGDDVLGGEYGYPSSVEVKFNGITKLNLKYGEPENENGGIYNPEIILWGYFPEYTSMDDICFTEQLDPIYYNLAYYNPNTMEMYWDASGLNKINQTGSTNRYWIAGDNFEGKSVYLGYYELDLNSVYLGYNPC